MSIKEYETDETYGNPLIGIGKHELYVMVSHRELDELIARLMHLAELNGDKEHRDAVKGELKHRTRKWLDDLYRSSGYINHELREGATVIDATPKNK